LPAFKALVKDAHVDAVMCAYNSTNGEPCCANTFLLDDILRNEGHFKVHVVYDFGTIGVIYEGHHYVTTASEAAALSVKKGVSLDCGVEYTALIDAVKQNLISEKTIDSALAELLATRFKLGMFDNVNDNPNNQIPESVINSPQHRALAKEVAVPSAVLLKNNGVLPLQNNLPRYYITGPNASNVDGLLGNYYGVNNRLVTFLEGLAGHIAPGSQWQYKMGCLLERPDANPIDWTTGDAKNSDVTIAELGLSGLLEGEEGESIASTTYGDRLNYNLPQNQIDYLKKLREGNKKPIIAIITGGSPMNLSEVHELADAVLLVRYPGKEGGNAAADIVFGNANPSARLPVTFPMSYNQLPSYEDYNMQRRTYRFMKATPMYPFGFGLSYNTFSYTNPIVSKSVTKNGDSITCSITIKNNGKYDGLEAVQLYVQHENAPTNAPIYALKAFKKIAIPIQGASTVSFIITPDMLQLVNDKGESYLPKGRINIYIGGLWPDKRSIELGASKPAMITVVSK
jgi:beta-glucosidase